MSYTSGIGGQQTGNAITPSGTQPVVSVDTSGIAADKHEVLSASMAHVDETAVSSTGGLVLQALEASDTRTAKVLSLQEAIAVGSYTVSSSDVANKIIQSLLK
ncbi:flagellar biosynthesis anti-sigma factor FlgM [Tunturibacter psychrotolerans]|uniref:Flagellar biosynthesis anti-sigma factor FlgM n=1 Tax=Tunturiibacter psychrotolerans TaxID=3069686 RepID=A0AAU7ZJG7_9BACT